MSRGALPWVVSLLLTATAASARSGPTSSSSSERLQKAVPLFTGDWDEIKQRGILRALVVYSRTLYFVDRGKQRGATAEILKVLEADLNAQLKTKALRFNVVFIPVRRDELIPALLEGRGDFAAADLIVTPERQERVGFSIPFREDAREIVVTGPSSPRISSVEDLAGQTVHVRRSSTYWGHLEALSQRLVEAGKPPVKLVAISEDLEDEDLLEMANAGLIPIVVCDVFMANFWKQAFPTLSFEPEVAVSDSQPVAWMIRKNNPQLKEVLDRFIRRQTKRGAFGAELLARYQKGSGHVLPATSGSSLKRFEQTVDIFRKYAGQYDLDYLLMIAQGYQDSRLDQRAISPVGAIGVMQVMPATGAQMRVGDINRIEPNIHAGVKYMRLMEDAYFDEPSLDPMAKALFTFASYNAGPNRIRDLRQEALKRGLDPNRWFKNVEYVVAERIGEETVTYVSNIFKYYIAYQLVADAEQRRQSARQELKPEAQPPAH
jgi:membrane-bound lytic murein transglycosylase MltF